MRTNTELQVEVLRALEREPGLDVGTLDVAAAAGVVTLHGEVPTYSQKLAADRAVQHVPGVLAVANDLAVGPEVSSSRFDTDIARGCLLAFGRDAAVPAHAIHISVTQGWVTLDGVLHRQYQRAAAERAIRRLFGVRGLTNNIDVRPADFHHRLPLAS